MEREREREREEGKNERGKSMPGLSLCLAGSIMVELCHIRKVITYFSRTASSLCYSSTPALIEYNTAAACSYQIF